MMRADIRARSHAGIALLACCILVGLAGSGCDDKVERTIGKMSSKAVESEYRVVDDPLLTEWVDTVGHTLVGYCMRQHIPYSFKVLDTDIVNAFAAPYGHIYVTTGLLDFAETEDEVWGVMGHEIGHVVRRHSMSSVKRGFLYQIGLVVLGGESRALADAAGVGLGLLSLRYSRENEYEADDMGRRLSYAAAYDPNGNADFFVRLMDKYEKKRPSSIEVMFRTHPPSERRIARQRSMPELSPQNPEALLRIGRGYARRHQLRSAEAALARAVELRPDDAAAVLALADVQLEQGRYTEAKSSYQTAAGLRPSPYAQEGIRLASADLHAPIVLASAEERSAAGLMLVDARAAADRAGLVIDEMKMRGVALDTTMTPAVTGTHSIIAGLFGLAETQPDLDDATKGLVTYANGAVNRAIDPVYSVERQRESLEESAEEIQVAATRIIEELKSAESAAAGDVAVLRRALRESRLAVADIRSALTDLERAAPAVNAAQESARETTRLVSRIMRGDQSAATAQFAQRSAQLTEVRALSALAATRKAKKLSTRAAIRALVARINVAAIGASPELRTSLDGLVAHYTLARPETVSELRGEGIGFGDAALALAASRSVKTAPTELARSGAGVRSMVDEITSAGARTEGAAVLLKYLANAMEYETKAQ